MKTVAWKKGSKPQLLLDRLKERISLTDDGRVRYSGSEWRRVVPGLHRMIEYKGDYSFHTKVAFRERALSLCAQAGTLDKDSFINAVAKEVEQYERKDLVKYCITTSVSVAQGTLPKKVVLPGSVAYFHAGGLPKKYSSRDALNEDWYKLFPNQSPLPDNYTAVVVAVKAKSPDDAFERGMSDLNYYRGILGLGYNPAEMFSFHGGGGPKYLNKVMLGGMHCVHFASGRLSKNLSFWYDAQIKSVPPMVVQGVDAGRKRTPKDYVNIRLQSIKRYPAEDQRKLASAIARYALAFDEYDYDTALYKLWSAMESLLLIAGQKADLMIRRCAYTFEETEYYSQVLEYIREYRNAHVHQGSQDGETERHCYALQECFRQLIRFYLGFSGFFRDLDEANRFLDNSNDPLVLERQMELLAQAKDYVQPSAIS
ncbi:MAG: hypothetical protein ABGX82_08605 [Pseudomonas sp.]|uniref:hypothetical protein n=1 Tax=Pseudomonas sp. TaxID=306 RepID=UPI003242C99F